MRHRTWSGFKEIHVISASFGNVQKSLLSASLETKKFLFNLNLESICLFCLFNWNFASHKRWQIWTWLLKGSQLSTQPCHFKETIAKHAYNFLFHQMSFLFGHNLYACCYVLMEWCKKLIDFKSSAEHTGYDTFFLSPENVTIADRLDCRRSFKVDLKWIFKGWQLNWINIYSCTHLHTQSTQNLYYFLLFPFPTYRLLKYKVL